MPRVGPPHPTPCARPDLAARLTEFDELPAAERAALSAHARACPSCGPALGLLEAAEAHLAAAARRLGPREACPSAEDLFDFAKAPGARPLPAERSAAVAGHVQRCAECAGLLSTLAARPPVPLIVDPLPQEPPRRRLRLLRPAPLAAAAAVALAMNALFMKDTSLAGGFFGFAVGLDYASAVPFSAGGSFATKALRYVLGLASIAILYFAPKLLLGALGADPLVRFLRYAALAAWGSLGAPWLFLKLGLAEREGKQGQSANA